MLQDLSFLLLPASSSPLPPSLCPSIPLLSVSYGWSVGLRLAPAAGLRSRGAPHAHALQHDLPWRLSCHCETPTLGCLCQQQPCALSLSALFMGSREVARRVAGSGRAFLQHCSMYPAFKRGRRGCSESWRPGGLYYLEGAVCSAKLSKHTALMPNVSCRDRLTSVA